jgi:hypothetical protein
MEGVVWHMNVHTHTHTHCVYVLISIYVVFIMKQVSIIKHDWGLLRKERAKLYSQCNEKRRKQGSGIILKC